MFHAIEYAHLSNIKSMSSSVKAMVFIQYGIFFFIFTIQEYESSRYGNQTILSHVVYLNKTIM